VEGEGIPGRGPRSSSGNLLRDPRRVAVGVTVGLAALVVGLGFWFLARGGAADLDPPSPVVVEEDPEVPELPPALLSAPVVYDLAAVIRDLEEAVPRTFGDLEERQPHPEHDRVSVAFEVEREPFEAVLVGDTARISTVLTYAGRAWYDPPLLPEIRASCGVDGEGSPPRARVGLSSRLILDEDWVLRSTARVDSVVAVSDEDRDRCRITPLNVDVTDTALRAVRGALEGRTEEIDRRVAEVDVRSRLQDVWHTLQEPVELTDDVWLLVNPQSVTQGAALGEGSVLTIGVGMMARPLILLGPPPDTVLTDLPTLDHGELEESARIRLEGRIHYAEAGRLLIRELEGREVELTGGLVRIREVTLSGIGGGRVAVGITFGGTARGTMYLVGKPDLDHDEGEIRVPELDFDLDTRNLLVGGLAWLGEERLLRFLRERARIPVASVMEPAREQLLRGMNRELSDEVSVEGEVLSSRLIDVRALRDALVVHAEAEARASFRVRQGG
jgi:hypothetical protein